MPVAAIAKASRANSPSKFVASRGAPCPDRILPSPQVERGAAVQDRHVRIAWPIGLYESSPIQNGDVQRFEIRWAHNSEISLRHRLPRLGRLPLDLKIAGHCHV